MNNNDNHADIPKPALIGAGLIIAATVALVALHQATGLLGDKLAVVETAPEGGDYSVQDAAIGVVASRMIRVVDGAEGTVIVIDDQTGDPIEVVAYGEDGFIRGVFRGLARERALQGLEERTAFRLTRYEDGRLFLEDPLTGSLVSINAFGATNIQSFAKILMHRTGETS